MGRPALIACVLLVVAASLRTSNAQVNPTLELQPDGSMSKISVVRTRLVGETICDSHTRASAGCCASAEEHKTKCCQNIMVCSQGHAVDDACDERRRKSTCCSSPYAKCCSDECFTTPEIKEKEHVDAEIRERPEDQCEGLTRDKTQCCLPGETRCCKRCPLPFAFKEIDSSSTAAVTPSSSSSSPSTSAKDLRFAAHPAAAVARPAVAAPPTPQCAPAGCAPAKNMVKVKVDCSAEMRQMSCCKGKNDHLWTCCQKMDTCAGNIGKMRMGTLCDELKKATTCCTTPANQGCCRQCASTVLVPAVSACVQPPTTCCSAQVTSCCKTC